MDLEFESTLQLSSRALGSAHVHKRDPIQEHRSSYANWPADQLLPVSADELGYARR